jgi:hypothetical protein
MATGGSGDKGNERTLELHHLDDTETGVGTFHSTRASTIARRRIVLLRNGDVQGHSTTTTADAKTATMKTRRDRVGGITETIGIKDADRTRDLLHDRDHQSHVWTGMKSDENNETEHAHLKSLPRALDAKRPLILSKIREARDALSRQHPTQTLSKPSSAPSHHLPNPLYDPVAAALTKPARWVSNHASPPHTTQQ